MEDKFQSSSSRGGGTRSLFVAASCCLALLSFALLAAVLGVGVSTRTTAGDTKSLVASLSSTNVAGAATLSSPLPFPFAHATWSDIEAIAQGGVVRFASYSDTLAGDTPPVIDQASPFQSLA